MEDKKKRAKYRLKNIRHEQFCQNLIKHRLNRTKAYMETYPDCTPESARRNASRLLTNVDIKKRALEILNQNKDTSLEKILQSFEEDLRAKRPITVNKSSKITYVRDNATQLEAKKTLLKMYGVLGDVDNRPIIDARQVNLNLSKEDIERLNEIISRLEALENRDDYISGNIINPDQKPDYI